MLETSDQLPLIAPDEPSAVEIVNGDSPATCFFLCDHASHLIPRQLKQLGLPQNLIETHIGWDIGAAKLARQLAANFAAPLVLTGYSRLVIDCNRPSASDGSIPKVTAGIDVPGNRKISAVAQTRRQETFFHPYHNTIGKMLDRRAELRQPTAIFAVHSFTPHYPGETRPWHVDFAYNRDRRLAGLLLDHFDVPGLTVGDNLPYQVEDESDYSIPHHGERRGLPHVLMEIRQDTLGTDAGIALWAERLIDLFRRLMPAIDKLAKDSLPS
jgi:predicted N-formylglutamate amidohydrolase